MHITCNIDKSQQLLCLPDRQNSKSLSILQAAKVKTTKAKKEAEEYTVSGRRIKKIKHSKFFSLVEILGINWVVLLFVTNCIISLLDVNDKGTLVEKLLLIQS